MGGRSFPEIDDDGALMAQVEGITRDGEVIPLSRDLGLRGKVLRVGWELPADLSEDEWRAGGALLGKIERSVFVVAWRLVGLWGGSLRRAQGHCESRGLGRTGIFDM